MFDSLASTYLRYDYDITIWSPQGRLLQLEYAMEAPKQGSAAVGLHSDTHAVLVALKRSPNELATYQKKIFKIDEHIGVAIAGLTSDARVMREALRCKVLYDRPIPLAKIVTSLGNKIQINTVRYGSRPYGVGILVIGCDEKGPHLYECMPSGNVFGYYAVSTGARSQSAKTYLEKNFKEFKKSSLDELIHHGLMALRDTLQPGKDLNTENCTVGVVGADTLFKIIENDELSTYIDALGEHRIGGRDMGQDEDFESSTDMQ